MTPEGGPVKVLNNYLSNAIKFTPPDSSITVSVAKAGDFITTRVADQGPGIPPEELPLIFKEFHRGSNRPTGGEKSTGLGLRLLLHAAVGGAGGRRGRFVRHWRGKVDGEAIALYY